MAMKLRQFLDPKCFNRGPDISMISQQKNVFSEM